MLQLLPPVMDFDVLRAHLKNILRNSFYFYIGELVSRGLILVLYLFVARVLGPSDFGLLSFVVVSVNFGLIACDFGYTQMLLKEISSKDGIGSKTLINDVTNLRLATGLVLVFFYFVVSIVVEVDAYTNSLILIYGLSQAVAFFPQTVGLYFRSQFKTEVESSIKLVGSLSNLIIGTWLVLIMNMGLRGFMIASVCASVCQLFASILACRRNGLSLYDPQLISNVFRPHVFFPIVKSSLPFGLLAMVGTISYRINIVLLTAISDTTETGLYNAAVKILDVCLILPGAISAVTLGPLSAALVKNKLSLAKDLSEVLAKYLFLLASLIALTVFLFSNSVVDVLYSKAKFGQSIVLLSIVIWTVVPVFASSVTSTIISASSRPQVNVYVAILMMFFNIGANLYLIGKYGGVGAAYTTLGTESLGLVIGLFYIRRYIVKLNLQRVFTGGILSLAFAFAVFVLAGPGLNRVFIVLAFLLCLFVIGELRPKNLAALVRVFKSRADGDLYG
jgi:O-antigen/teichoic acid export membrane protein